MSHEAEETLQKAMKEIERLKKENTELRQRLQLYEPQLPSKHTENKTKEEKLNERVNLFRSLFKGREDVFAYRWEMDNGKSGYSPARSNNRFLALTHQDIYDHLRGKQTIGLYPVLHDQSCWFLAVDFDKKNWQNDAHHFVQTCNDLGLPVSVEKSRSGNGCHAWIFFQEPVKANVARKFGRALLTKTMEKSDQNTLKSYDRMFPNQDTVPEGKVGNLIALPLQGESRKQGNSVFVDENFHPYPNQWLYLSTVKKVRKKDIDSIVSQNHVVRESSEPVEKMPGTVSVLTKDGIYISKQGLPQYFIQELAQLARFSNPAFYKAEKKRLSTKEIPRIIDCSEETESHLILPRGCMEDLNQFLEQKSIEMNVSDERNSGAPLDAEFHGTLSIQQEEALQTLLRHHTGVLSATTGFGKTVIAATMIAKRKVNTLVIVHRKHLMDQWKERLKVFLKTESRLIGQIGGGKNTAGGNLDIATIQSLNSGGIVKDIIKNYGQIIVDECHHIPAFTFEKVLKKAESTYMCGLTATPIRTDGLDRITRMQLGPIRYKINAKEQAKVRPFKHILMPRYTSFKSSKKDIQAIYSELVSDQNRNEMIFNDVLNALEEGKSPIILTERIEHVQNLASMFRAFTKNLIVLTGELNKKEKQERLKKLEELYDNEERLIIATGKYIGEGFDNARLDTMFLTMPVSGKGTLHQYVGRMHRLHDKKMVVQVYDYVDHSVPMLARMFDNRKKSYKTLGYVHKESETRDITQQMNLF
ncbi:helicase [Lentibacillus kapialis]|uniref:Helicase n=1 Tax=Lentibacillus kapialis TaxID=340214 RepID=A0A917Q1S5_9BACI|nr:DEAD/DEAH box helicase [Lentibacillus kapialis]GGK06053.1 helicase [Lentibacillus kapialis]